MLDLIPTAGHLLSFSCYCYSPPACRKHDESPPNRWLPPSTALAPRRTRRHRLATRRVRRRHPDHPRTRTGAAPRAVRQATPAFHAHRIECSVVGAIPKVPQLRRKLGIAEVISKSWSRWGASCEQEESARQGRWVSRTPQRSEVPHPARADAGDAGRQRGTGPPLLGHRPHDCGTPEGRGLGRGRHPAPQPSPSRTNCRN